jgi:hypothetical protein
MTATQPKSPTPQAGFNRVTYKKTWVATAGYRATKAMRGEGVQVRCEFLLRQSAEARRAMLTRYAEAITADGWNVEVREYDLIVTTQSVIVPSGAEEDQ